jgi:ABC-2 type transport system ATP-binding protein
MSETVLTLSGITKEYKRSHLGRTTVSRGVIDINLEVQKGEVFGLLGLNGSGKTTTIKLILGLLFPSKGTVRVLGEEVPHQSALKRIGYLPEVPIFYRNLTPDEVLNLYGYVSKMDPRVLPDRIQTVLEMVKMTHARKKPMRDFSKGMLQRIGLAQSILHDPDILVLDEPVTGLDPLGIHSTRQLLADINKQGKTLFFSSHSISELEKLAHRVGILVEGRLVQLVTSSEWRSHAGGLEGFFIDTLKEHDALV